MNRLYLRNLSFNKGEDWYEMEVVSIMYLILKIIVLNNALAHYLTKFAFFKNTLISGIMVGIYCLSSTFSASLRLVVHLLSLAEA